MGIGLIPNRHPLAIQANCVGVAQLQSLQSRKNVLVSVSIFQGIQIVEELVQVTDSHGPEQNEQLVGLDAIAADEFDNMLMIQLLHHIGLLTHQLDRAPALITDVFPGQTYCAAAVDVVDLLDDSEAARAEGFVGLGLEPVVV